jgi:hypothetical protein
MSDSSGVQDGFLARFLASLRHADVMNLSELSDETTPLSYSSLRMQEISRANLRRTWVERDDPFCRPDPCGDSPELLKTIRQLTTR